MLARLSDHVWDVLGPLCALFAAFLLLMIVMALVVGYVRMALGYE